VAWTKVVASKLQFRSGTSTWIFRMSQKRQNTLQLVRPMEASVPERMPGKVTHDSRGNAVWDWDIATGVLARKSVAELITELDAPGVLALDADSEPQNDWSGDPYNRGR
jgi:hypothetical protein